MEEKKTSLLYRIIRWLVWLVSPRLQAVGTEHLPEGAAIVAGNHAQMYGPIGCELHFPGRHRIWCAGQMMHLKEVPAYAYEDFWSFKPKWVRPFFRLASYVIAPLAVLIFNNARTIPVYRDTRLLSTFRETVERLHQGERVVIFPEYNKRYNNILYDFQDKFIDIARLYYKKYQVELPFVPLYLAPRLKRLVIGEPILFDHTAPIAEERQRIRSYLMAEITRLAAELPPHSVIPYRNIRKRDYPKNRPVEMYDEAKND